MKQIRVLLFVLILLSCLGQAIACSVWTDKSEYNLGEMVTFYYSTNVNCNVKITVVLPDGHQGVIFNGRASAGQHQLPGQAWEPCGMRRLIIDVTCKGSGGSSEPIHYSYSGDSNSCESESTFNVVCGPSCNRLACQSRNGPVDQPYIKNGWVCQIYNVCNCINNNCNCEQVEKKLSQEQTCDSQACQSQNGPVGQPYSYNGEMYQKYKACDCIDGSCQCSEIPRKVPCTGTVPVQVKDEQTGASIAGASVSIQGEKVSQSGTTDYNGATSFQGICPNADISISGYAQGYLSNSQSITTDSSGNAQVSISLAPAEPAKPVCSGAISGYVYDDETREPISEASLLICQEETCWSPAPSDSSGHYTTDEKCYSSKAIEITCSANNYETATQTATTDEQGNANLNFYLKKKNKCTGVISLSVYDSKKESPISGASLLICQDGKCWSPPVSDEKGFFITGPESCPLAKTEITCSAENYETDNLSITTDTKGNADLKDDPNFRFNLKPKSPRCPGIIDGRIFSAKTNESIPGANILICQNGSCWSPSPSDSLGRYSSGKQLCPFASVELTCSADGYKPASRTLTTDGNGYNAVDFGLEPELSLEAKVSTDKKEYSMGEEIVIHYETNIADAAKMITVIFEGTETPAFAQTFGENNFSRELAGTKKLIVDKPGTFKVKLEVWTDKQRKESECEFTVAEKDLVLKVWTDKAEYKSGEEVTVHYEINNEDAARRLTVISKADPPTFNKEFGENTFSKEMSGTRKVSADKPGAYKVKFEGWTDKQSKNVECEFNVIEKDLALKVWTDKTEYKADEEITIHYETGVEDAARRITVTEQGTQTQPFSKTFEENDFSKEANGTRSLTLNKSASYEVKLEAWTGRESKEARCKFTIVDKDLALKVWTDKTEYKSGEDVTIYYETDVENAARRITVTEQGTQTPLFSKAFAENTFSKEESGARNLTIDKPGTYAVKLEAWTGRERKDTSCEFTVQEKDLALKVWTNKTEYNAGEDIIIYYETGVESAARRITVNSNRAQAPVFNKAFEENTFAKEKSGSRKISLDQPGPYEIKLEAWTANDKKEAQCQVSVCGGTISGRVLNSLTSQPVQGAAITICAKGKCYKPITTDSSGQYNLSGFCTSIDYELTCAANGYQSYKGSNKTDENGDLSQDILLEPICNGEIAGKVLNSITKKPVSGAYFTICMGGKCSEPHATDSSGKYYKNGCPSTDYEITCSADGYKIYKNISKTDEKGNSHRDILLEPDCAGTISGSVLDSLSKEAIQGSNIAFCINQKCSDSVTSDQVGRYSRNECCPSTEYEVNCSAPGYLSFKGSVSTDDKGSSIYDISLDRALSVRVWTDKAEYKLGEEITINYETGIEEAARRITVTSQGTPATAFGENTFQKEKNGAKKITPDKSGTYDVKLEAWTAKDRKEAKCQFKVVDKELALKIWTDKTDYKAGEEITLHYETGVLEAARRIVVSSQGTIVTTLGENTFQQEKNGIRTLTLDKPGTYEAKLEAWTSTQRKETTCKFNLGDNEKPEILIFNSNLTSPQKPGIFINFIALSFDPESDELQYKFWLKGPSTGGKWKAETDWVKETTILFSKHFWVWQPRPQDNGKNEISVWVRDDKHAKPEGFDAASNLSFEIMEGNIPPNIISVNFMPGSSASIGLINILGFALVKIQAYDQENDTLQYRFELKEPGGDFKVAANWQSSPLWSWQPSKAGEYELKAMATDGRAEAEKIVKYTIINKPPVVELELSPPGLTEAGTEIKCKATATDIDGDAIQYKFWLNGPTTTYQWEAKTEWMSGTANGFFGEYTWSWKTGQADVGKNAIRVWVRDGNHAGTNGFDAFNASSIDIIKEEDVPQGKRLEITSFKPMFSSPQDVKMSPIMWTTIVSKPDDSNVEYQFEESRTGSDFQIIKAYSSSPLFIWVPKEAGNYKIKATVRNLKGETDSKIEEYTITDSSESKPKELTLIIRNAGGHKMPANGGVLKIDVTDSKLKAVPKEVADVIEQAQGTQKQAHFSQKYEGGLDEVSIDLKDITSDSIDVSVFQTPGDSNNENGEDANNAIEYWGNATINRLDSQGTAIFVRNTPWIETVSSEGVITIQNDGDKNKVVRLEFQYSPDNTIILNGGKNYDLIMVPANGSTTVNLLSSESLQKNNGLKLGDILNLKILAYVESDPSLAIRGESEALVDQWDWMSNPVMLSSIDIESYERNATILKERCDLLLDTIDLIERGGDKEEYRRLRTDFEVRLTKDLNEYAKNSYGQSSPIVDIITTLYSEYSKDSKNQASILDGKCREAFIWSINNIGIKDPYIDLLYNSFNDLTNYADSSFDIWLNKEYATEIKSKNYITYLESLSEYLHEELNALENREFDKLPAILNNERNSKNDIIFVPTYGPRTGPLEKSVKEIAQDVQENLKYYRDTLGLIKNIHDETH